MNTFTNTGLGGLNGGLTYTGTAANSGIWNYSYSYQCSSCGQIYPTNVLHCCPNLPQFKQEENVGSQVAGSYTQAIEIIYRFGNERVKATLIKGVSDSERAEELFLAQFGEDEDVKRPEIIAAVEVLVAA